MCGDFWERSAEIGSRRSGIGNRELKAGNRESEIENRESGTGNRTPGIAAKPYAGLRTEKDGGAEDGGISKT